MEIGSILSDAFRSDRGPGGGNEPFPEPVVPRRIHADLGGVEFDAPEPERLSAESKRAFAGAGNSPTNDLVNDLLSGGVDSFSREVRVTVDPLLSKYDFIGTTAPPASSFEGCHKHASISVDGLAGPPGSASLALSVEIANADNGHNRNAECAMITVGVGATITSESGTRSMAPGVLAFNLPDGVGRQTKGLHLPAMTESTVVDGFSVNSVSCSLCTTTGQRAWTDEECSAALFYDAPELLRESQRLVVSRGTVWEGIEMVRSLQRELERDTAYARSDFVLMLVNTEMAASFFETLAPVKATRLLRALGLGQDVTKGMRRALESDLEAEAVARNTMLALKYSKTWSESLSAIATDVSGILEIMDSIEDVRRFYDLRRQVRQRVNRLEASIRIYELELRETAPDLSVIREQLDEILRECRQ